MKTFTVTFESHTGEACRLTLEAPNVWEAYEFCKTLEIPHIYEMVDFEILD